MLGNPANGSGLGCEGSDDVGIDAFLEENGEGGGGEWVIERAGERVESDSTADGIRLYRPVAAGEHRKARLAASDASANSEATLKKITDCASRRSSSPSCSSSNSTRSKTSSNSTEEREIRETGSRAHGFDSANMAAKAHHIASNESKIHARLSGSSNLQRKQPAWVDTAAGARSSPHAVAGQSSSASLSLARRSRSPFCAEQRHLTIRQEDYAEIHR